MIIDSSYKAFKKLVNLLTIRPSFQAVEIPTEPASSLNKRDFKPLVGNRQCCRYSGKTVAYYKGCLCDIKGKRIEGFEKPCLTDRDPRKYLRLLGGFRMVFPVHPAAVVPYIRHVEQT